MDYLLGSIATFDVSPTNTHTIYTVPSGKTAVVTKIVIRSCAGTLNLATDAVVQWGCNASDYNNVAAARTLTAPTGTGTYQIIEATAFTGSGAAESTMCTTGQTLRAKVTTSGTTSTTCTMEAFGYLF